MQYSGRAVRNAAPKRSSGGSVTRTPATPDAPAHLAQGHRARAAFRGRAAGDACEDDWLGRQRQACLDGLDRDRLAHALPAEGGVGGGGAAGGAAGRCLGLPTDAGSGCLRIHCRCASHEDILMVVPPLRLAFSRPAPHGLAPTHGRRAFSRIFHRLFSHGALLVRL